MSIRASNASSSRAAHLAGVVALGFAFTGCEAKYDQPPTRCDDWCHATQRANCAEDWPDECVSECEFFGPSRFPKCTDQWDALLACYSDATDTMFQCVFEVSTPRAGVCESEYSRYERCAHPVWQSCLESCAALYAACESFDFFSCRAACAEVPSDCLDAVPYFDCVIERSDSCEPNLEPCATARTRLDECPPGDGANGARATR